MLAVEAGWEAPPAGLGRLCCGEEMAAGLAIDPGAGDAGDPAGAAATAAAAAPISDDSSQSPSSFSSSSHSGGKNLGAFDVRSVSHSTSAGA